MHDIITAHSKNTGFNKLNVASKYILYVLKKSPEDIMSSGDLNIKGESFFRFSFSFLLIYFLHFANTASFSLM